VFSLYSNDLPGTRGRKFIYADDVCLAIQGQYFSELECSLSSDMVRMSHFCRQWRLKPSHAPPKQSAVCSTCILPALPTNCQFIYLDGQRLRYECLRYECHPTYLGVTLDHMLSYREHLTKTAGKLKNRNNLLMKLASSTWSASANTLRSSALALCYSAAEYWLRPSLVTLCSHKSGRCAVELYHAFHLWYPPFYTSPMASSALQH